MKVWWVLAWDCYYPRGGLNNVQSQHETKEEAQEAANQIRNSYDSVEVVDISHMIEARGSNEE